MDNEAQTYADHFDEIHALGIKREEDLELFCRMKGGTWLTDNGKKRFIEPDPGAGLELLANLRSERLREAGEANGFDRATVQALVAGKISAKQLGITCDLSVTLPGGIVRSL